MNAGAQETNANPQDIGLTKITIDGKEYTFNQISNLSSQEKSVILKKMGEIDPMILEDYNDFYWQAAQERLKEAEKRAEASLAEEKSLDKQLVEKYTLYIGNAEILGKGSKRIFNKIINFNDTPEALKQRTRALLADKNMKWED